MIIDFNVDELQFLSNILEDLKTRDKAFHFLSCSQDALLCNLINKVDNELSV